MRISVASLCLLGVASVTTVCAQTVPPVDAGALRQQIERELKAPLPGKAPEIRPEPAKPLQLPEGQSITVSAFRFEGNTLLDEARLRPVVAAWLNRPIGINELQAAAQAVANAYREAGWIVRVYLPKQDVTEGVVTIQIVEAVFSGTRSEGPEPTRVKLPYVLSRLEAQQTSGAPLNADALDRGLLLADDLPGVSVTGALMPGDRAGETALVVKTSDEPLLFGEVTLDNHGSRSTGEKRAILTSSLNSPLGIGDLLRVDALTTRGSDYARLGYSLPVGADGWRLGINASKLDYRLVPPEFAALDGNGDSTSVGVDASYPLIRSRLHNLYLTMAWDDKRYRNLANQIEQSNYAIRELTVGLSGNLYDSWGGGGANTFSLTWTNGRVDLGATNQGENTALAGSFGKLRYQLGRTQVLTPTLSLHGAVSGQYANEDLDSSERFYLGGPGGVRAYPVNEGGGSRGELAKLELRWRLPQSLQLTGFYDWGQINNLASGPSYELKGYGLALSWSGPYGLGVSATWARRDGNNPNPTATGRDQDGSLDRNRVWLAASLSF